MLMTQYFDTLKEVGTGNRASTVFLNHAPGGMADLSQQMSQAFMQAAPVQSMGR